MEKFPMPTERDPCVVWEGDCLELLKRLPEGSVNALVCDPPFGARRPSAWRLAEDRFDEVCGNDSVNGDWLPLTNSALKDGGAAYVFTCWDKLEEWRTHISKSGLRVRSCIVWDKVIHGLGDLATCWGPQHELILFAAKGRHELKGSRPKDVIRCQRLDPAILVHPYQKPSALIREIIRASTEPGDIIIDPFFGSGTTGVAAIVEGRKCIGIEKDPHYCEIARRRIAEALGRGKDSLFREVLESDGLFK